VTAATAQFDNRDQEAFLTQATYDSEGRTAQAEKATLHSRPDGTLARVEAQGNVTVKVNGATVVSQRADVVLNAASQPQSALLAGGVRYSHDGPLRQLKGQADEAAIAFDGQAKAQPQHAVFTGSVHLTERTRATEAPREPWSTRELTAAKFDAMLAPAGPGKSQLRDAEATGNPHLMFVNNGSLTSSSGMGTTEISADDLKAHMLATGDASQRPQLDTIAGRGHTLLRELAADGTEQTSAGDALDAKFRSRPATSAVRARPVAAVGGKKAGAAAKEPVPAGQQIADTIESAVQQGHVTMMRRSPAKAGAQVGSQEDVEHASAERAVFDGGSNRMTLSGGVQLTDAGSELWANQVVLDRATGDSLAVGAVKVEYVEPPKAGAGPAGGVSHGGAQAEPTHILAERAEMDHATEVATFHGKPVRMWQGGNQVQAPVIEIARVQKRIIARGENATGWSGGAQAAQVHTVLVSAGSGKPGAAASSAAKAGASKRAADARTPDAVRVASGGLVYSGILRQADFTGGIRADTADGTIRASQGTAYLQEIGAEAPAAGKAAPAAIGGSAGPSLAGNLDRVVATGDVEIDQPGLHATGERLVYTASDQVFLLTGDDKSPPKAVGARGTTTGAALRLRHSSDGSGSDSVEVLGEVPGMPAQRVRTDSMVDNDAKKNAKGKR
jgi:lipopolysaccharide export system protein LptA